MLNEGDRMFIKTRILNPYEKYILEVDGRIKMDTLDQTQCFTIDKGYTGEKYFYEKIKDCLGGIKIWDYRLKMNGEAQYDFIVIHDQHIIHFDIKYYEGNYHFHQSNFISENNYVITDPVNQLVKADMKLNQFVQKLGLSYKVLSYVVFVGQQFTVSGFNGDSRILFDKDIDRIVASLNKNEPSDEETRIGQLFLQYHYDKGIYQRIHYYPFEEIQEGIKCPSCNQMLPKIRHRKTHVTCSCGYKVSKKDHVKKAFEVIQLLKNDAVTVDDVVRYTGISKTLIREVLSENFEKIGMNKNRKYHSKEKLFIKEVSENEYEVDIVINDL